MSLATRCTSCGTVFRVVQDQLKVSEGWVRCGRCSEVFNALEGLFDLEREAPPDWTPSPPIHAAPTPGPLAVPDEGIEAVEHPIESPESDKIDAQLLGSRHEDHAFTPGARLIERDRLDFPDARFDPESTQGDTPDSDAGALTALLDRPEPVATEVTPPEFMRHAQRRARWQRPWVRGGLAAALLLLSLLLAGQGAHHFRDQVSARWPEAAPVLLAWCKAIACSIDAPHRIDDVSVESTALTRAGPDAFKLAVALRNKSRTPVALPSIDLSLTDQTGQLIARRMLLPPDFRAASAVIPARAESAFQVVLTTGDARVSGYTVEVFYP